MTSDGFESLQDRLERLAAETAPGAALSPASFWKGDKAGERQVKDDWAAGRMALHYAHRHANSGLAALKAGDMDLADVYAWESAFLYIEALKSRIRPDDVQYLSRPAKKRGRPPKI